MNFSQYCRIESAAGGIGASDRTFIRAALKLIKPESRFLRKQRDIRHEWLRDGLKIKQAERVKLAGLGL